MTKEKAIKKIAELFKLAGLETKEFKNSFGLIVKSENFPISIEEAKGESLLCVGNNGINFHCQCDSDDEEAFQQINSYGKVVQNIINKIQNKKEKIKMTRAERIAKAKAILAELDKEMIAQNMVEKQTREEYLDAQAEASEEVNTQPATSIEKLFQRLAELSPDYDSWNEYIVNACCSENIYRILENKDMSLDILKRLRDTLEVPYKMWRRIDAHIKRHSESE